MEHHSIDYGLKHSLCVLNTLHEILYSGLSSCSLDANISRKRRSDIGGLNSNDANLASRIVNGIAAADNSWPWLARLAFQTQSQYNSNSNQFRIIIHKIRN